MKKKRIKPEVWILLGIAAFCGGCPFVPLVTTALHQNLCESITPDLQSVAEKPVRCDAGYIGISVTTSEADFERVRDKVQEMIDSGRIGCSVRVETDTFSNYVDLPRR